MDRDIKRQEYIGRVNRVVDYIQKNLEGNLGLDKLAQVSGFSKFHFHRIFKAFVGETLKGFVKRLRVEKAAMTLLSNPKDSITDIALDCGFGNSQAFSRDFKKYFKVSPSEYRQSKNCQMKSKVWKEMSGPSDYIKTYEQERGWKNMNVKVKDLDEMTVAYIRHIGPYKGDTELFGKLFGKLMKWAGPRDLVKPPETKFMAVYYDDPDITDEKKLRVDVCITVPTDTKVEGEIGKQTIPGGKYAVSHVEIDVNQYEEAWNQVWRKWLPESGYQPDDRPCLEFYLNDPKEHPEGKHIVDICVPVKPL